MAVNPLPPQAYTKETLQKAYTWLLTQGPAIKEIASSQDMLISLYLKAQRNGEASLETPSIQNFKQELKSLAGIMGDLQVPSGASASSIFPPSSQVTAGSQSSLQQIPHYSSTTATKASAVALSVSSTLANLDLVSLQAISEVKQVLNLSSDMEALRALIALGHKQIKKM